MMLLYLVSQIRGLSLLKACICIQGMGELVSLSRSGVFMKKDTCDSVLRVCFERPKQIQRVNLFGALSKK